MEKQKLSLLQSTLIDVAKTTDQVVELVEKNYKFSKKAVVFFVILTVIGLVIHYLLFQNSINI